MHQRPHPVLFLGALLVAASLCGQKPGDDPGAKAQPLQPTLGAPADHVAWQRFQEQHPGTWVSQWNPATGTPKAIFGSGLPIADWRENSLTEARRHADKLLRDQGELLGLGTSEFRESIGARMGRTWSFVYEQYFRGLPVLGGRADVRVNMVGRIAMFGSVAFPIPADFVTVPRLDELAARRIAWAQVTVPLFLVGQPGVARLPRLVIWGDAEAVALAPFHLAWEIPISAVDAEGNGPIGRYYVDANTGAVLHYTNDKHECGLAACTLRARSDEPAGNGPPVPVNTTGTVMAWVRPGNRARHDRR